jgi:hypothetical protein
MSGRPMGEQAGSPLALLASLIGAHLSGASFLTSTWGSVCVL